MNDLNVIIKKKGVFMFGLFKKDPAVKLEKEYKSKLTEAMNAQRNGNIEEYARLSSEADSLLQKLNKIKSG